MKQLEYSANSSSRKAVDVTRQKISKFLITNLDVQIDALPEALENFTIVHLTDLHFGPLAGAELMAAMVDCANSFNPDIIAITGDFLLNSRVGLNHYLATKVDPKFFDLIGYRRRAREFARELSPILKGLSAKEDIFVVAGNHEHIDGFSSLRKALPSHFHWLTNDVVQITRDEFNITLGGIDDIKRGKPDSDKLLKTLSEIATKNASFNILLCHNPDIVISKHQHLLDQFQLMLSGHTHGGQICLPIIGPLLTNTHQRQHIRGLSKHKNTHIYVSNGIGYGAIKLRLLCPAEIAVFRLKRTQ